MNKFSRSKSKPSGEEGLWEEPASKVTRRAIFMDVYGDTGTGRTRFSLTAPGPIALAHAAEKIDGLVQQAKKTGKDIKLLNFGGVFTGSDKEVADAAFEKWKKLQKGWYDAVGGKGSLGWAKSGIMDTGTEGWELIRLGSFGTLTPKGRTDNLYGPVNAKWRSLFKPVRQPNATCNIITIHQTQDEYKEKRGQSERTGRTIRRGMKEIPFLADVIVRTSKEDGDFKVTIEKGWYNASVEGIEFFNEDATFANVMAMITETDAEEWE